MSDGRSEDTFFGFGDFVRSIQNPNLTGQVVGEADWFDRYQVRLADGATTIWWNWIEMELDPDMQPPPAQDKDLPDNVIKFPAKRAAQAEEKGAA